MKKSGRHCYRFVSLLTDQGKVGNSRVVVFRGWYDVYAGKHDSPTGRAHAQCIGREWKRGERLTLNDAKAVDVISLHVIQADSFTLM